MTDAKEFAYIGHKITKLREEKGWTQVELSRRADVTGAAINQIVKAGHTPSLTLLTKLAKAFKVSLCDLIYDATERDVEAAEFYRQYGSILSLRDEDREMILGIVKMFEEKVAACCDDNPELPEDFVRSLLVQKNIDHSLLTPFTFDD